MVKHIREDNELCTFSLGWKDLPVVERKNDVSQSSAPERRLVQALPGNVQTSNASGRQCPAEELGEKSYSTTDVYDVPRCRARPVEFLDLLEFILGEILDALPREICDTRYQRLISFAIVIKEFSIRVILFSTHRIAPARFCGLSELDS